jgi:hypothetical protein
MLTNIRQSPPAITLALSVVVALAAGYFFFWLWRELLLFALVLSALLLMSGGLLLSNKKQCRPSHRPWCGYWCISWQCHWHFRRVKHAMTYKPSNPALNPDALHAASRYSGRRLAPRYPS